MQDIIEGTSPECPQDWIDLYEEYNQFMKAYNPMSPSNRDKKRNFCLTDTGHEINLQWLDCTESD